MGARLRALAIEYAHVLDEQAVALAATPFDSGHVQKLFSKRRATEAAIAAEGRRLAKQDAPAALLKEALGIPHDDCSECGTADPAARAFVEDDIVSPVQAPDPELAAMLRRSIEARR